MKGRTVGVVMNGVTGRMGTHQHLMRSIVAIREQGGVRLDDGGTITPVPVLVGRNGAKLAELATRAGEVAWTTDLDEALADPANEIYFDAQTTDRRFEAVSKAIALGKHVYCEKPTATGVGQAYELYRLAQGGGREAWGGAGQALAPGAAQAEAAH